MKLVILRSRRRTLSLTVNGSGEVIVRAPLSANGGAIDRFLKQHEKWLTERIAAYETHKLDLSDGAELVLFGKKYYIGRGRTALKDNVLLLPQEERERSLTTLLKKIALRKMTEITNGLAAENGFRYQNVRISSARGRWGSCNKDGVIAYTFRIAFLPPEIAEYVAVHELCHTRHFNHSAAFWNEVGQISPYYVRHRKSLKKLGYLMNCL